ncbi:MAG: apolipoprotein N-acyltransferase [Planctomycetaceae bacterium]|nr:apolipoprotein N-acyltransferase [Planctomycetaceae bacterium]MCB9953873.1 apolipoprotein N-acyltransferase [Planctomycetaceae bacterium]
MSSALLEPPVEPRVIPRKDTQQLVDEARKTRTGGLPAFVLATLTSITLWCAFTPLDFAPLAWLCLVPLLQVARLPEAVNRQTLLIWLAGAVFWVATLQWMRLGDIWMYPAWMAHSLYLACYFPLFVWLVQVAVTRFRTPLVVAAPVVWVGLEYLRGHLFTGFSWYLLGHTQHNWVNLIQISDLCGGYLVSFVIVLVNAALAQMVPVAWLKYCGLVRPDVTLPESGWSTPRFRTISIATAVGAVALSVGYGVLRRAQVPFEPGPRVALIQGNFPATTKPLSDSEREETWRMYHSLTGMSVKERPDVVVWPEAMCRYDLVTVDPELSDDQLVAMNMNPRMLRGAAAVNRERLEDLSGMTNAALILGVMAFDVHPGGFDAHNSAVFVSPDDGVNGRYDKIHLVPFGEYIPLSRTLPFLNSIMPYGAGGGMKSGDQVHVFEYGEWRFVPNICFEDTVPHLVRSMVSAGSADGADVDVLVNMSNDGWFHGSSEHDQHLISASFRCVETRVPMVRAANMGISAIIDGDGVIREPEVFLDRDAEHEGRAAYKSIRNPRTGRFHRQLNAAMVSTVPLDKRGSLYVAGGDWFALICLICCASIVLHSLWQRFGKRTVETQSV